MQTIATIVQTIAFVILAFYAWASYELQRATRASTETERDKLDQFREAYETRLAPEITAELQRRGREGEEFVALHLKNIGNTDALYVELEFEPSIESFHTFEDGLERLASGDEFEGILGTTETWRSGERPARFDCRLRWEDDEGLSYDKKVALELALAPSSPELEDEETLAGRLSELERQLEDLRTSMNS